LFFAGCDVSFSIFNLFLFRRGKEHNHEDAIVKLLERNKKRSKINNENKQMKNKQNEK
jgi:hypothetical protein